jgi:hypothetical protein
VQAVWVLYTGKPGSSYHGTWAPLDLVQNANDPTLWEGTLTLQAGENAGNILFMVQAVGGAGLTTLATNLGAYYSFTPPTPPQPPAATTLTLQSPPSNGTYLKESTFHALLESSEGPLSNQLVSLNIGGQQTFAFTNASGVAELKLTHVIRPGPYTVEARFRGNAQYLGSNDVSDFTIDKDSTTLMVTPCPATLPTNPPTKFFVALCDSSGRPLGGKSVFFIVHNGTQTFVTSAITDFRGNALLGQVPLPVGTYTVDAYFMGPIPPLNPIITLSDDFYESSSRTGLSLEVDFVFTGFFDPVKNPPVMNEMNAGRSVPIKFSLGGNQGLAIFAAGFPRSRQIQCSTTLPTDNVEGTTTATSALTYDPLTDVYTYIWKTERSWNGTCRQLSIQFVDGQTYLLNFIFR